MIKSSLDDMKNLDTKFKALIQLYQAEICEFEFKEISNNQNQAESTSENNKNDNLEYETISGLLINSQQHGKICMIMRLIVFYGDLVRELIEKECLNVSLV